MAELRMIRLAIFRARERAARIVFPDAFDALVEAQVQIDQARVYADTVAEALADAIGSVKGREHIAGRARFYEPQIDVSHVERWRRALRDGEPIR